MKIIHAVGLTLLMTLPTAASGQGARSWKATKGAGVITLRLECAGAGAPINVPERDSISDADVDDSRVCAPWSIT